MKDYSPITVINVLSRKHFEQTIVIAGNDGLGRQIKWVHVVEVTNIRKLLNGHELILTTGVSWKETTDICLSFLQQLIDSNASGLCVEMGTHTSTIPKEMIEHADKHQFPIIIFQKEVPFVEITQDIHTYLINQQYKMISDLEQYAQSLNKKLLTTDHYHEILQFFQQTLDTQVIFRLNEHDMEYFPNCSKKEKEKWQKLIKHKELLKTNSFGSASVQILGHEYAEVMILSDNQTLNEFDFLLLDRTSTALAQHLLRDLYVGEKKRIQDSEWILDWLNGQHTNEGILEYLLDQEVRTNIEGGVVLVYKYTSSKQKTALDSNYFKLLFRTVFEQQGFTAFLTEKSDGFIFILLNRRSMKTWKQRLSSGIERMRESEFIKKQNASHIKIGVGKFVESLNEIHKSYLTAEETVRIQKKMGVVKPHYFYEELHLFRLISIMNKQVDLREFVLEYLHPIFEYDKRTNGKLLETLRIYLACNGSKQETAKRLFIVRQTLYHRIGKIEKLLGEDFMTPEKRVAIEFMLLTYDYLLPIEQREINVELFNRT
ncbi:PucR family transcriptional regulator [Metabacillus herbersteinensis]|uniref:PucR family transcriptional regulator n=1 Tax=Metabacillus herbersteinensis TaxID=283816 RepID=A0ABV6GH93_9BACI